MTIALIIFALGLASAVLLVGHLNHERRRKRDWYEASRVQPATIRARRPRRRPF